MTLYSIKAQSDTGDDGKKQVSTGAVQEMKVMEKLSSYLSSKGNEDNGI